MKNISINTEELKKDLNVIKNENDKLDGILNSLNNETNYLKDFFQTNTSDELYSSFDEFKKRFEETITFLNNDISFLDKVVSTNYSEFESSSNTKIDEDIVV